MKTNLLLTFLGLIMGNVFWQLIHDCNWLRVVEVGMFQFTALFNFWIVDKITRDV